MQSNNRISHTRMLVCVGRCSPTTWSPKTGDGSW